MLRLFTSDFFHSGHLPKNGEFASSFESLLPSQLFLVAAKLAPLLDGNRVTAEGTMRQSNSKDPTYFLSVSLKVPLSWVA